MRKPTLREMKERTAEKLAMEKKMMVFYDHQDRLNEASHQQIMEDLRQKEAASLVAHEKRMAELAIQRKLLDEEIQKKDEALEKLLDHKISVEEYMVIMKKGL